MKKKQTFITRKTIKTEAIDIVQNVVKPKTENSPLVASSPLRFTNTPTITTEDDENFAYGDVENPKSDNVVYDIDDYMSSGDLTQINNLSEQDYIHTMQLINNSYCNLGLVKRLGVSCLVATGTGLAMMPVFNYLVKNSEQFGVDVHNNKIIFDISTANTFIVASFSSFVTMNEFIKKHQTNKLDNDSFVNALSKVCASFSLILPLGLLWVTEVNNQKIAESSGFDQYMAWATFSTIPLVVNQVIESITNVNKVLEAKNFEMISLNDNEVINRVSIGSKIVIYGLAATSLIGRSIAFTEVCKSLALASGVNEEVALGLGIAIGGILTSSGVSILEYNNIKILFETTSNNFTMKKAVTGTVALAEGIWFTLPLVSIGLDATSNWNPLLKGGLFVPLLASHTVLESTRIYDNMTSVCNYISDGFSSLKQWCCNDDDIQLVGDNNDYS